MAARGVSYSRRAMIRRHHVRVTKLAGKRALSRWGNHSRMPTAYSIFTRTCMSGAATGMGPTTMRFRLIGIRRGRQKEREKRRAEVPGGTRSRFHDALPVPASRRNSNTLIMLPGRLRRKRALAKFTHCRPWHIAELKLTFPVTNPWESPRLRLDERLGLISQSDIRSSRSLCKVHCCVCSPWPPSVREIDCLCRRHDGLEPRDPAPEH